MRKLSESMIASLLAPYVEDGDVPHDLYGRLDVYLDLLLKWNARMNLTAIRAPEEIVTRHFGESLFLARQLPVAQTLLDAGSGAGFPGIPVQLFLPELTVTLAECQGKKAAFLRECVRTLELDLTVWPSRVEAMPVDLRFGIVTMRAVDKMEAMLPIAKARVVPGGCLALLGSGTDGILVPGSDRRAVRLLQC